MTGPPGNGATGKDGQHLCPLKFGRAAGGSLGAGKGPSTGPTHGGHSEGPDPARALRMAVIELEFRGAPGCKVGLSGLPST